MAAFVKTTGLTSTNGGTTTTYVFGSAPAATTNTVIVSAAVNDIALTAGSCTDSQGGTYALDKTDVDAIDGIAVYVWRRTNALSTGSTITVTLTSGSSVFWSGVASEYSGVGSTITTGTSGGGTTQPFSETTAGSLNAGDLVISCVMANGNASPQGISNPTTGGTGTWVTRAVQQDTTASTGFVGADKLNGTGGAETATSAVTGTPFTSRIGIIVGYISAGGSTTTGALKRPGPGIGPDKRSAFRQGVQPGQTTTASLPIVSGSQGAWTWSGTTATVGTPALGAIIGRTGPGLRGPFNNRQFLPNQSGPQITQGTPTINATVGAWAWTGTTSATTQLINQSVGAWSWSGTTATTNSVLSAILGAWQWAGTTATTSQLIAQTTGTWSWSGTTANTSQLINSTPGAWSWAGTTATTNQAVNSSVGTWTWSGTTATFGGAITATVGAWSWSGTNSDIPGLVNAIPGAWAWSGTTAGTSQLINAGVGAWVWSGTTATTNSVISTTPGVWTWSGTTSGILQALTANAIPGQYVWSGTTSGIFQDTVSATGGFPPRHIESNPDDDEEILLLLTYFLATVDP